MKKIFTTIVILLLFVSSKSIAQTLMPMPAFSSVYSGSARGYWLIAPCNFKITGLRVPSDAGTGLQYIHVMKCHDPFPVATTGSTNFTTLLYISGAANNVIQNVNISINQGDTIGIMGTAGTGNSYTASGIHTSTINGLGVTLTRLGYQGDINTGPAPNYWGTAITAGGSISRVEMYYTTNAPCPNNASVSQFIAPTSFCAGYQDIKVKIKNTGNNIIDSVTVKWQVNGITQTPISWTSPLDTLGGTNYRNDTIITIGNILFPSGITKTIKVWTEYPNAAADTVNNDDTVFVSLKPALNGTFTIGGTTPDYATLSDAVTDLNANGVCGPVVFNIRNGTYNGQYQIGNIAGASAVNTIQFKSETQNQNNVILSFNSTTANNYILKLNNATYVTFRHLSLTALNTTYANIVEFAANASYNTIDSCKLTSATATASSTGMVCIYANDLIGGNNTIKNNTLLNGSYGVYWYGTSSSVLTNGNVFENNSITDAYYYSMHFYYNNNLKVRKNTINSNTTYASHVGIRTYYSDGAQEIIGNYINIPSLYGMYLYYNDAIDTARSTIANNVIIVGGTGAAMGIRSYYSSYQNFYNNSININSTSTTGYAGYFYYSSASYIYNTIRNNVFSNKGSGRSLYVYNAATTTNNTFDYNNLYANSSVLVQEASPVSVSHSTLASWQNSSNQDRNSVNYFPSFTGINNLMPNAADSLSWAFNGLGVQITNNNTDFNGNIRSTTLIEGAPDLGAYEFTPSATPSMATAIPATPLAGTTQSFVYGVDTVAKIIWDASATAPASIEARLYQGVYPAGINTVIHSSMNAYWEFITPSGSYNYTLKMMYRNTWIGSNYSESSIVGAQKTSGNPWVSFSSPASTIDTTANVLSIAGLNTFSIFTGTDNSNPLPVKLISFQAKLFNHDVILSWSTASEINSSHFIVEASVDGITFIPVGEILAKGNSSSTQHYSFTHTDAFKNMNYNEIIYYRLNCMDKNNLSKNSGIIQVQINHELKEKINILPNPFSHELSISMITDTETKANITLMNIEGKIIFQQQSKLLKGTNLFTINNPGELVQGIYFVQIEYNGMISVQKIVKY